MPIGHLNYAYPACGLLPASAQLHGSGNKFGHGGCMSSVQEGEDEAYEEVAGRWML